MATLEDKQSGAIFALNLHQFASHEDGLHPGQNDLVIVGVYIDNAQGQTVADKRPILRLGEIHKLCDKLERYGTAGGLMSLRFLDPTLRIDLADPKGSWRLAAVVAPKSVTAGKSSLSEKPVHKESKKGATTKVSERATAVAIAYLVEKVDRGMIRMDEENFRLVVTLGAMSEFAASLRAEIARIEPPPQRPWDQLPV